MCDPAVIERVHMMKLRPFLTTPLLMLAAACTTTDVERNIATNVGGFAMGVCERSSSCTVRDTDPRYGPQQQRVVEDTMRGRQEPM